MLIQLKNITKEYTTGDIVTPVLRGIDLSIAQGEFLAIMGPSGSGKSTLMHILGFLDRASSGEYFFEDADTGGFDDVTLANLRNKRIGFVFQAFNLLARTSVLENVALPLLYSERPESEKFGRAEAAIEAVGLTYRKNHLSNQISGGQKQRVAIARALVNDPAVIFADEPTGNLDSISGKAVMAILSKLHREGKTIILVTHDRHVAEHANRIITVRDGRIVSDEKVANPILPEAVDTDAV